MLVPWLVAPGTTGAFYLFLLCVMSPVCFVMYGLDKRRARRQQARISERTLQLVALAGGWPGAWLGQRVFHHKTEQFMFRMAFRLIVLLHVGLLCLVLFGLILR
jgi:uncharacterized membrane protein YsdA (DUF1294 family)